MASDSGSSAWWVTSVFHGAPGGKSCPGAWMHATAVCCESVATGSDSAAALACSETLAADAGPLRCDGTAASADGGVASWYELSGSAIRGEARHATKGRHNAPTTIDVKRGGLHPELCPFETVRWG
jgi:hypothetical protein